MSILQSKKYFNDSEVFNNAGLLEIARGLNSEKIKLEFCILNSKKGSSYSIISKIYEDQLIEFRTGIIKSDSQQTLTFNKFMICDYFFEKQQDLMITIKKDQQIIDYKTTLGSIIGSKNCSFIFKYNNNESLMIKAEKLAQTEEVLNIRFFWQESAGDINYFVNKDNKMFYIIFSNNKQIYSSPLITNLGIFEPIQIPICLLEPFYTVTFYTPDKKLITSFDKRLDDLMSENKLQLKLPLPNNHLLLLYDNSIITKNFSFIDYIGAGVKIALSIGIDFTGPNGRPLDSGAIHSIKGKRPNDYYRAIESCGNIVGYYDYDQLFPVYGFGAVINSSPNKVPSMCFNLNFTDNPDIKTIENVLKTYKECIEQKKLTLTGPALFAPLIKEVASRINSQDLFEYHILMILTNGVIEDLQQTIDALVEVSSLPLSVIIIGIGNDDFSKMEILDGDDIPLISTTGKIRMRDLVQFVPFSRYKKDEKKLMMEVLGEIPRQIVEYYQFKNLNPIDLENMKSQNNNNNYVANNNFQAHSVNNNGNNYYINNSNIKKSNIQNNYKRSYTDSEIARMPNPFYMSQNSTMSVSNNNASNFSKKNNKSNVNDSLTSFEQFSDVNKIDLDNIPIYETIFINKNN